MAEFNGNFSHGIFEAEISGLGNPIRGKVRDNWIIGDGNAQYRLMVTTDRQAVNARPICTIPGKGQLLNLISAYWFERTKDIVPNSLIAVPHPNILFAKQAKIALPVEVVLRRYLAKSATSTSVYYNYAKLGRREIYGIPFPEGLQANQELPMGTILTPTTKALDGNDQELTDAQAEKIVDGAAGKGVWDKIKTASFRLFEYARKHCLERGIILADSKFEFGMDDKGKLMLIDEVLTPECSRFWVLETYQKRVEKGKNPEPNKDVLADWLAAKGFNGKEKIPLVDHSVICDLLEAYTIPYGRITESELPAPEPNHLAVEKAAQEYLKSFFENRGDLANPQFKF